MRKFFEPKHMDDWVSDHRTPTVEDCQIRGHKHFHLMAYGEEGGPRIVVLARCFECSGYKEIPEDYDYLVEEEEGTPNSLGLKHSFVGWRIG